MLQGFVPNQGDAWRFTLESMASFWDEVAKLPDTFAAPTSVPAETIVEYDQDLPAIASDLIGHYLSQVRHTRQAHRGITSGSGFGFFRSRLRARALQPRSSRSSNGPRAG